MLREFLSEAIGGAVLLKEYKAMAIIPDDPRTDQYAIQTETEDIIVRVIIGDGQTGNFSVYMDDKPMGHKGDINLGKKAAVAGRKVKVITIVTDVLLETNRTSATIFMLEGSHEKQYGPFQREVPLQGDSIRYKLTVECA